MKKILIYISLIVFAVGGCKKIDLDEVPSGDPVFTTNATLDGVQLNLVAGDDNFYMFSEFSNDTFDVYTMTGRFAKDADCQTDCEESLSFSIRSNYATPGSLPFDISQALEVNSNNNYYSNSIDSSFISGYSYDFTGFLLDTLGGTIPTSYDWEISIPNQSPQYFSGNELDFPFFGTEDLEVQLSVTTNLTCTSYYRSTISNGQNSFCGFSIEPGIDSIGAIILNMISNNQQVNFDSIFWNGSPSGSTFVIAPGSLNGNLFIVNATDTGINCNTELGICIEPLNPNQVIESFSFPQFELQVSPKDSIVIIGGGEQLAAVTIEYEDATGIYSSEFADNSSANSNSTFTITKIENYEDNEIGEKTKKLTITYNCILGKEGSGETKNIVGSAEIAVAYPE